MPPRHVHVHCSRDRYPLSGRVPRDPLKHVLSSWCCMRAAHVIDTH